MSLSRLGLLVPPVGPWSAQARGYRWAEEVGYDVVYTADHLTHPIYPGLWLGEAFTTLAAAAAVTDRIMLGTLVASAAFRSPVSLARVAMSVQDVSAGRLVLGVGMGAPFCVEADRGVRESIGELSTRFADVVRGYLSVLDGATDWQGDVMAFGGLETTERPEGVGRPELVLAGHGPRSLALAAAHADTWNTYGGPGTADIEGGDFWQIVSRQVESFVEACDRQGRDPTSIRPPTVNLAIWRSTSRRSLSCADLAGSFGLAVRSMRRWCGDPALSGAVGERGCDRSEQAAVVVVESGPAAKSAQHMGWWRRTMISRFLDPPERMELQASSSSRWRRERRRMPRPIWPVVVCRSGRQGRPWGRL